MFRKLCKYLWTEGKRRKLSQADTSLEKKKRKRNQFQLWNLSHNQQYHANVLECINLWLREGFEKLKNNMVKSMDSC